MSELAEQVRAERAESHSTELDIDIAGVRLSGWLHQVQDDGLLRWRPATLSAVDGILLWLEHWCTAAPAAPARAACMAARIPLGALPRWRQKSTGAAGGTAGGLSARSESAAAVAEQERLGVAKSVLSAGNAGNRLGGRSAN